MPVCAAAGSEPAPAGGWLAGQHRPGDLGEPALHRLRGLRAVDGRRPCSIRTTSRPGTSCGSGGPRRIASCDRGRRHTRRSSRSRTFTQAQLMRRSRAAGGLATARSRAGRSEGRRADYVLRGLMRCGICPRKMQGATIGRLPTTAARLARWRRARPCSSDHPKTVNLREMPVVEALNGWIGQLFDRENIDATVAALLDSQAGRRDPAGRKRRSGGCWTPRLGSGGFRTRSRPASTRQRSSIRSTGRMPNARRLRPRSTTHRPARPDQRRGLRDDRLTG